MAVSTVPPRPAAGTLYDVIDVILDKGLVIDAYVRVSLVGVELITVDVRVVIASVDTYLHFAEATNRLDLRAQGEEADADIGDLPRPAVEVRQKIVAAAHSTAIAARHPPSLTHLDRTFMRSLLSIEGLLGQDPGGSHPFHSKRRRAFRGSTPRPVPEARRASAALGPSHLPRVTSDWSVEAIWDGVHIQLRRSGPR
jgi:hypothetical protein